MLTYLVLTMTVQLLTALTAFAFVSSVTPGPNNMMLLSSGVNFGFRRSMPHMLGIGLGFGVMTFLVGAGIGQAFTALPWLQQALKLASIAYMLWLAWRIATAGALDREGSGSTTHPLTFLQAAAFQWINPKAWTMCLTAVAAYSAPDSRLAGTALVAVVFTLVNIPSISLWTMFGVSLRGFLRDPRHAQVFNIAMAIALVASLWPIIAETWQ